MESIISLRAFAVDDPETAVTCGILGETDNGDWEYGAGPDPGRFGDAIERYVADELDAMNDHHPTPQRVYDGVVVVLDELVFRVVEDEMEHEFRLSTGNDLADGQTICSASHDTETGITAQSMHDDAKIASAVQRAADALDHRIAWIDVISPRSFDGVVDAAEDMLGNDEEKGN